MANGRAQSWDKLLEQRKDCWLIGRQREREIFRLNFIYQVPEYLIFSVCGPAGIGKSALVHHYGTIVAEHGASTVYVDAGQQAASPDATLLAVMAHMARQLSAAKTALTTFDERYDRYNEMVQMMANDATTPAGVFDFTAGLAQADATPAWDAYMAEKLWTPDQIALVKHPVETLTGAFLQDMGAWATIRTIVFCFDDWDVLGPHIGTWVQGALRSGHLTSNVWLILAGEARLDASWEPFRPVMATIELPALNGGESRSFLLAQGVSDAERISAIWTYAKGLPLWMRLLSETQSLHSDEIAVNVVDRYLKGLAMPWQRELVLRCAAARRLDTYVVAALMENGDPAMFEWLVHSALVVERAGAWIYHPALRTEVLGYARQYAPDVLQAAHANLHAFYSRDLADAADVSHYADPQWRKAWLESLYHGLMSGNINAEDAGLETFLLALRTYYPLAGEIVGTWSQAAGEQAAPNSISDWVQPLETGWRALKQSDWQAVLDVCALFAQHKGLNPESMQELHTVRQLAQSHLTPVPVDEPPAPVVDETVALETTELEMPAVEISAAETSGDEVPATETPVVEATTDEMPAVETPMANETLAAEPSAVEEIPVVLEPPTSSEPSASYNGQEKEAPLKDLLAVESIEAPHITKYAEDGADSEPEVSEPEKMVEPAATDEDSDTENRDETPPDTATTAEASSESAEETPPSVQRKGVSVTKAPLYSPPKTHGLEESEIDAMDYSNRANVYLSMGEYEKAVRDYDRAVALDPKFALAYYNRGLAHMQLGDFEKALEDYTQTIELNPAYAPAYKNRGLCHARKQNYAGAVVDYTKAIELASEDGTVYNNRANAYYHLKAYLEAINDYDRAIHCDPQYAPAYLNRGLAYASLDEYQQAIADYNQALLLSPNQAVAYNYRGQAYARLEQYASALADYAQALTLNPQYTAAHNNRGLALVRLGNYAEAIAAYQRAVAISPKFATAYYNAACAAALMGDFNGACDWLEKAIALHPQYRAMARTDVDFNAIRESRRFQRLLEAPSS
ncbi:MAG: tetratricopeptide repeat protein [Anaerolineae bacterium]|nr:tetratricopeptide repeat protein [Anaerolineae bacterium]